MEEKLFCPECKGILKSEDDIKKYGKDEYFCKKCRKFWKIKFLDYGMGIKIGIL